MSKYVKNLVTEHLRNRLNGVQDALLVSVVGLKATANNRLRTELQGKNIHLMVVKNSLAKRAVEGTPLARLFEDFTGPAAICWGAEDIVSLAKEVTRLVGVKAYEPLTPRGGVMDGAPLSAEQVAEVSKWPSRQEQLSLLVGQILGPGGRLVAQLSGPGGTLGGQIKEKAKEEESAGGEAGAGEEAAGTPSAG
jgi:large subunit ribosomal protein L10